MTCFMLGLLGSVIACGIVLAILWVGGDAAERWADGQDVP